MIVDLPENEHLQKHFTLTFPVRAIGKGSVRFSGGRSYMPNETKKFMRYIQVETETQMRGKNIEHFRNLPVKILITAYFKPAKSKSNKEAFELIGKRHHTQKPDATNIQKIIEDALLPDDRHGFRGMYDDDSQVSQISCSKRWFYTDSITVIVSYL